LERPALISEATVTGSNLLTAFGRSQQPEVIDERHLVGMTLGDVRLEREVLELFLSQAALMLDHAGAASPITATAAAHRFKGSARAIGAWRLARAAKSFEQAVANSDESQQIEEVLAELRAASLEACAAIAARLHRSSSGLGSGS
jgi:HPt (histidine-containing phosphotransfer) domain-containing protein